MQKLRLSDAKTGSNLRILGVEEPDNAHVLRLCELGFVPGASLKMHRNCEDKSPLIVDINDARMCVEKSLAQCFWVET